MASEVNNQSVEDELNKIFNKKGGKPMGLVDILEDLTEPPSETDKQLLGLKQPQGLEDTHGLDELTKSSEQEKQEQKERKALHETAQQTYRFYKAIETAITTGKHVDLTDADKEFANVYYNLQAKNATEFEKKAVERFLNHSDTKLVRDNQHKLSVELTGGRMFNIADNAIFRFNDEKDAYEIEVNGNTFEVRGGNVHDKLHEEFSKQVNYLHNVHSTLIPHNLEVEEQQDLRLGDLRFNGKILKENGKERIVLNNRETGNKLKLLLSSKRDIGHKVLEAIHEKTGAVYTISERASHEITRNTDKGMRVVKIEGRGFKGKGSRAFFVEKNQKPNLSKFEHAVARDVYGKKVFIHKADLHSPRFHVSPLAHHSIK